jgi:ribosomal protein S18 acetylase RimI-like enzyme
MIYRLEKTKLRLLNLAVKRTNRRMGVGQMMIEKLIFKLSQQRRTHIIDDVRETNLPMHKLLQKMGFEARGVERDAFDNGESAYHFVYELEKSNA